MCSGENHLTALQGICDHMLGIRGQNNIKEECFIDDNVSLSGLISFRSALNPIGKTGEGLLQTHTELEPVVRGFILL